jgi:hypothetical protein
MLLKSETFLKYNYDGSGKKFPRADAAESFLL